LDYAQVCNEIFGNCAMPWYGPWGELLAERFARNHEAVCKECGQQSYIGMSVTSGLKPTGSGRRDANCAERCKSFLNLCPGAFPNERLTLT